MFLSCLYGRRGGTKKRKGLIKERRKPLSFLYRTVIGLFPKMAVLVRMWKPNSLGDISKYNEQLPKNCLKVFHLPLSPKIRDTGNLLSSKLQLNLNCNSVFTEVVKWVFSRFRWSSNLLKEFIFSQLTSNSSATLL